MTDCSESRKHFPAWVLILSVLGSGEDAQGSEKEAMSWNGCNPCRCPAGDGVMITNFFTLKSYQ